MKDTYYFSHDYSARSDQKIKKLLLKHGYTGYGIYWALIEDLYQNANAMRMDYDSIAYDLHSDSDIIKSIINDFDLFVIKDDFFGSMSVQRRLIEREAKSAKASKSASIRWEKEKEDANAMRTQCDSNAIKERKGKEKKVYKNPTMDECIEYAKEIGCLNPISFFEHYDNTDWNKKTKTGDLVPVKNWKNTMRTWLEKQNNENSQKDTHDWATIDIDKLEAVPKEQWERYQLIFVFDRDNGMMYHKEQMKFVSVEDMKKSKRLLERMKYFTLKIKSSFTILNYGTAI